MSLFRISIGNLGWNTASTDTGEVRSLAILRPKDLAKGRRVWGALGGGAMLTSEGKEWLENAFKAQQFELDYDTGFYDMRFVVDEKYVEQIFHMFVKPVIYEQDPTLDIKHELAEDVWEGCTAPLSETEIGDLTITYDKTVRQRLVDPKHDTSRRATELPTHRLFRTF